MSVYVLGGGTFNHVRAHCAIAAPAFGGTARAIHSLHDSSILKLTKMADHTSKLVTNDDVSELVDQLIADPETKVIYFNVALCDFEGQIGDVESGKYAERLKSREGPFTMNLTMADKVIGKIRKERKDIFVVGFKTTSGATSDEQYVAGLNLLKANSVNLVLANDIVTRNNMIIAPEESRYCETTNRDEVLDFLVKMVKARSTNRFTRSTVIPADPVSWDSPDIPENLRTVVNYCIAKGAYKPFRGATVGHFAARLTDKSCVTSMRKTNFNLLDKTGMVKIEYDGRDRVIAHGFKPSVGGQSQRIIFDDYPDVDAIVHFHCPLKENARDAIPVDEGQAWRECGSHECGEATSNGLRKFGDIRAVMLDNHGPNIVFSKNTPAEHIIEFIESNFDLEQKTGGLV